MAIEDDFPKLAHSGYRVTSPESATYNCIAWAAGDDKAWWEPSADDYWPDKSPTEYTVEALKSVYENLGYTLCDDLSLESGAHSPGS